MSITNNVARAKTDYDEVYEAGKKSQYDEFWDVVQQNGTRANYLRAFAGTNFNWDIFYPKYDIRPTSEADNMFYSWDGSMLPNQTRVSLKARLEECGVVLDTSKATSMSNMFSYSRFIEIPTIDVTGCTRTPSGIFSHSYSEGLTTIEKIIVNENTGYSSWFNNCTGLVNVTFEGTIAQNGLNLSSCQILSKASITNIINHLSATTSGLSVTLSKAAVNKAFATTEGGADGSTSTEWNNLVATRSNWTITLS